MAAGQCGLAFVVGESLRVDDEAAHRKRNGYRQACLERKQPVGVAVFHHEKLVLGLCGRQEHGSGDFARHVERGVGDVDDDGGRRRRAHGDPYGPLAATSVSRMSAAKTASREGRLRVACSMYCGAGTVGPGASTDETMRLTCARWNRSS